jgi:hypothetical protein
MFEKTILSIAVAFSLYWVVQIKPAQRSVAIEVDFSQAPIYELPAEVSITSRI